ncbi:MAG: head GIN domain-containing protein [Pyrinomonadaceae bacterium]
MKKYGLLIFVFALSVGLAFSTNCSFGGFKNLGGVQGSGTSKTETRNVSGFSKIDAGGAMNVEVSIQKNFSVEVQADDNLLANIKTETSGDTLKIYSEDRISPKTRISIKISMPEIKGLDVSGASSGNVSNVNADSLELKASGASKIKIDGTAKELNADASGNSTIDAENLKAEDADVDASGASSATVSASGDLKVEASGASKIAYVGEPKNIKQNSSGASSVVKK